MKNSAAQFFSKLPLLRQISEKFVRTDTKIAEMKRDLRLLSAEMYFPRKAALLTSLLAYCRPKKVVGFEKIHIGAQGDGGYVMLDDFASATGAYSLGIADDVSWDLEMAKRGLPVRQFDFSIKKSPVDHPLFTFSPRRIDRVGDIMQTPQKGQILKLDIEGAEWTFFGEATSESLSSFTQIVGEFHYFSCYYQPEWQALALRAFQNLHKTHQLIHIHGNNAAGSFFADKFIIPDLIEFTFVLRSQYQFEETDERFPGPFDFKNTETKDQCLLDALLASPLCDPPPEA